MSCPDLDTLLDAGFDAPADVRAHLASCPACADELAAAAALAAGFAEMRTETAPAAVVDAALRQAHAPRPTTRRAADRGPRRGRSVARRWALAAAALALCAVVAIGLLRGERAPEAPAIAGAAETVEQPPSQTPPDTGAPSAPPSVSSAAPPAPAPELPAAPELPPPPAEAPSPTLPTAGPPPPAGIAPESAEPRRPATSDPAPQPTLDPNELTPAPIAAAATADAAPDSVAAAREGALLAFSLVADAQRVAGRTITSEAERLGTTLSDAVGAPNLP